MDSRAKDIVTSILLLPTIYPSVVHGRSVITTLAWNDLCINLTANLDLLEVASGRNGLEAASTALVSVAKWSRSTGARRAILHAAQIFDILDSSRVRESHITRPDLLLFLSALVLSLYLFVSNHEEVGFGVPEFELLQKVDWAVINGEGIEKSTDDGPYGTLSEVKRRSCSSNAALDFRQHGCLISFAGESQEGGGVAARKVLLKYAHLADEFGKWDGSRYSQLLRTMGDFMMEGGQGNNK